MLRIRGSLLSTLLLRKRDLAKSITVVLFYFPTSSWYPLSVIQVQLHKCGVLSLTGFRDNDERVCLYRGNQ